MQAKSIRANNLEKVSPLNDVKMLPNSANCFITGNDDLSLLDKSTASFKMVVSIIAEEEADDVGSSVSVVGRSSVATDNKFLLVSTPLDFHFLRSFLAANRTRSSLCILSEYTFLEKCIVIKASKGISF